MNTPGHDLVVGGSGMLAGLCRALARRGRTVSVLARNRARIAHLARSVPDSRIIAVPVDYRDDAALDTALTALVADAGPIDRAVCWLHTGIESPAAFTIGRHVGRELCHVLGSATADPSNPEAIARWRKRFADTVPGVRYRIAVLGFVLERATPDTPAGSRWLTDEEISAGVGAALDSDADLSIVGTVVPWSARP